ncbi:MULTISPECIES: hypothetical protein [Actinomycetes]|uniref:Terminase small subunit n=2 Tax=Actinomycetes TaxID=1760 RepID=A0ABU2AHY3_9ACTN|nr:hypothetical protein [Glycomyces lechevalierae]MDR7336825.1 hypothetical protein [Glycomyces lechevalierae]
MPNPPSLDPVRHTPKARGIQQLPASREGKTPPWPLDIEATPQEKKAWRELWKLPQAAMWEQQRSYRMVGRYCRAMVEAEQPEASAGLHAQVTAMEDRLGLTPKAMRLLLWEIKVDEVAAKRSERTAEDARKRMRIAG